MFVDDGFNLCAEIAKMLEYFVDDLGIIADEVAIACLNGIQYNVLYTF